MQTTELPVCNIGLFGNGIRYFWMDDLSGLLEKFPDLEFPHRQDFYTLFFIETAEGELIVDNHKIRLDKAKAIIVKPRCVNSININRQAKGKIICYTEDFFSLRYNNNILYQFSFLQREAKPYIRLPEKNLERWRIFTKFCSEEYKLQKRESQKVLRSYLNILLFELDRLYNPLDFAKNKSPKQDKIQQFEKFIEKNYKIKKLPSAYAEMLHVSPNYLNKICKEETGQTAGDLIRKRITIEAQRLLHYTNHSVNEIADTLGFDNTSYFVTFFKKQTSVTPEQFRKNQTI